MDKAPNVAMRGQPKIPMKLEVPEGFVSSLETTAETSDSVEFPSAPPVSSEVAEVHCMCSVHKIADNCCQGEDEVESNDAPDAEGSDTEVEVVAGESLDERLQLLQAAFPQFEQGKSSTFVTLTTGDGAALVLEPLAHQMAIIMAEKQGDEIKRCSILLDRDDLRVLQDVINRVL